jgi:hypothetical protein
MSQSLHKAKQKLNTKIAKEHERISVAGSVCGGSVASSQALNLGNFNNNGTNNPRK